MDAGTDPNAAYRAFREKLTRRLRIAEEDSQTGRLWLLAAQYLRKQLEGNAPEDAQALREMLLQLRDELNQDLHDLRQLSNLLPGFIQEAEKGLQSVEYSAHYRRARWASRLAELQNAFAEKAENAVGLWTQLFAESLGQWRLDHCRELVDIPYELPASALFLRPLFQTGLTALSQGQPTQALGMLNYLTRKSNKRDTGPEKETRALLLVLSGRIYLKESKNYAQAKADFDRASELLPRDSRPPAALSQYYLAVNDIDAAEKAARKACEQTAAAPSGFISMGLLLEHKQLWRDAREWYERALDLIERLEDPYLEVTGLLAPVSGQLLQQLARRLEADRPGIALKAADASLAYTLPPDGQYPEKTIHQLRGALLLRLERPQEAANSLLEAGKRYLWDRQSDLAEKSLRRSLELDDSKTNTYWFLVSALRDRALKLSDHREMRRIGEEAINLWQRGTSHVGPDQQEVWVLLERALLNEVLLTAEKEKQKVLHQESFKDNLLWQGIAYIVRALLINFKDVYSWTNLSRFLRMLRADQLTRHTTRIALECDEQNSYALEERIIILTNTGANKEARRVLEQLSDLNTGKEPPLVSDSWLRSVRAFQNWQGGAYREAVEAIDELLEADPNDLWLRNLRGICHHMLGNQALALQDFDAILEKGGSVTDNALVNDNWFEIVAALFHTGLLRRDPAPIDAMIAALEEVSRYPGHLSFDPCSAGQDLGMAYLARYGLAGGADQLALAKRHYRNGIDEATNPWKITEQFQVGFHLLSRTFPDNEELARCLEALKEAGQQQLERFTDPPPAIQSIIDRTLEQAQSDSDSSQWIFPALRIVSALVQRKQDNWLSSLELMEEVRGQRAGEFPEIDRGMRRLLDEFTRANDTLVTEGRLSEALTNFRAILRYEENLGHADRAVSVRFQLGDLCFRDNRITEAVEWHGSLADLTKEEEQDDVWMRLGFDYLLLGDAPRAGECFLKAAPPEFDGEPDWVFLNPAGRMATNLLRDREQFWEVYDQLEQRERTDDVRIERVLGLVQSAILRFLEKALSLRPEDSKAGGFIPMVNAVILELSDDLRPPGDYEQWPVVARHYPAVQQRISSELGVPVPDLRMRTQGSNLNPGNYLIFLDEVPMQIGTVNTDQYFCPHAVGEVEAAGVPRDQLTAAAHPVTDAPAVWVPRQFAEQVLERGLELWRDPLRYPLGQLEALVRRYLVQFVSVQTTQELLEKWGAESGAKALIQRILPGREELVVFTQLLKALLKEQVAINDWRSILEALEGQLLEADRLPTLLVEVRSRLLPSLPGNRPRDRVQPLPEEIERQFDSWVWEAEGKEVLAMPPEETKDLLADIRDFVGPEFHRGVLMVRDAQLRLYIRRLIELEFPYLYVIAQSELLKKMS